MASGSVSAYGAQPPRLLLYLLAFSAPAVLLPTLLLWPRRERSRAPAAAVLTALAAGVLGLGVGWVVGRLWSAGVVGARAEFVPREIRGLPRPLPGSGQAPVQILGTLTLRPAS